MSIGRTSQVKINSSCSFSLGGTLEGGLHGIGPSSESPQSQVLFGVVLPRKVFDDLCAAVHLIAHLMDGVAWLTLGSGLSLANSIHALVLQREGEDPFDG